MRRIMKRILQYTLATLTLIKLKLRREPQLIILTYHRILPFTDSRRHTEQPGMIITPEGFRSNINTMLRIGAQPVTIEAWHKQKATLTKQPKLSFSITFDDGWLDNYQHAYPVLKEYNIPGMIFLVSHFINTDHVFWPERLISLVLDTHKTDKTLFQHKSFKWLTELHINYIFDQSITPSIEDADKIICAVKKHYNDNEINQKIDICLPLLTHQPSTTMPRRQILNQSEIKEMIQSGLMSAGSHTINHLRLNMIPEKALENEIIGSKSTLETMLKVKIDTFCYPNGDQSEAANQLVQEHYSYACTTKKGINVASSLPHQLMRFNLHDGNAKDSIALLATIHSWG